MNEVIRQAISRRAASARSKEDLVLAIFETFRAEKIDVRRAKPGVVA